MISFDGRLKDGVIGRPLSYTALATSMITSKAVNRHEPQALRRLRVSGMWRSFIAFNTFNFDGSVVVVKPKQLN